MARPATSPSDDRTGRQRRASPSDLVELLSRERRGAAPSLDYVLEAIREAAVSLPAEERKQLTHALLDAVSASVAMQGSDLVAFWKFWI
jgi:hypothetical protein